MHGLRIWKIEHEQTGPMMADSLMIHCATTYQNNWNDVKTSFLEMYPEDRSLPSLISELSSVTRQPRETITELFIRVEGIVAKLETMKPAGKG